MTVERIGNGHGQDKGISTEYILSPRKIDIILAKSGVEFGRNYKSATDIRTKYVLASNLIRDGRYERPVDLLEDFLPDNPDWIHPCDKALACTLKERLHFSLIEKGILSPDSMSKEASERYFQRELERRQNLKDLLESGIPIEVMGQLMAVDLFSEITDEKKMEEYRAWTTRSILRLYVGTLSGRKTRRDLGFSDVMDRLPRRIFEDPAGIKFNLVENYLEQRLMRSITDSGIEEGFAAVDSLIKLTPDGPQKEFIRNLTNRFLDIATFDFQGNFNTEIRIKNGTARTFPSFEQKAFTYDFIHHGTRLLAAETGLGKTGTAFHAMENSDAAKVLVIAPADNTAWPTEDEKLFKNPGNIFVIRGSDDLVIAQSCGKKYIVISQKLLGRCECDPALVGKIQTFVRDSGIDACIIDEIDNLNKPSTVSAKTVLKVVGDIRKNYAQKTGKDEHDTPLIGLTATPIRNKLANLNVSMGILYPDRFAVSPKHATETVKTFSDTCLNRPDLAHAILVGERRMFRWEQATGVQEFTYHTEVLSVSAFEDILYTFIVNEVPTSMVNKVRLLENALFNPLLVKAEVREMVPDRIPQFDLDDIQKKLARITREWKKIRPDDYLSADRLVELGMGEEVLACFFSDLFEDGIDTLVEELCNGSDNPELADVYKFWKRKDISSKYAYLEELLYEKLSWKTDGDGRIHREKVFIVSPSRKQGRTADVIQRDISSPEGNKHNLYAPYELTTINDTKLVDLIRSWTGGLCNEEDILVIDGNVSLGKQKDEIISRWINDPKAAVLIVTLEATYQSRDYTLAVVRDQEGREITGIEKVFLSPPWYYQQLKQMAGRSIRQGHLVPVHISVLESEGLVDHGKGEAVLYSYLLSRMALSGIALTPEEQQFFDSKRIGRKISFQSPDDRFLSDALSFVRGAGEEIIDCYMKDQKYALFAEKFFDEGMDEYHITGHNAALVASLARHYVNPDSAILSIGAGTLLFQRKLQRGIDNVDMNIRMLEKGWDKARQYGGRIIEGRASKLSPLDFPDGSYDLVENSFSLHWSKLDAERVVILCQINRVLREGGKVILTVPEKSFDDVRFYSFINALEKHFGFVVDREFSGKSYGRSKYGLSKRLGWCIVASKKSQPELTGLDINNLEFANENGDWISTTSRLKNGNGMNPKDYPVPSLHIDFDQFEIMDPAGIVTTIAVGDDIIPPVIPGDEVVNSEQDNVDPIQFLKGSNKSQFREYRALLLRPAIDILHKNWTEVEEVEGEIFEIYSDIKARNQLDKTTRSELFTKILKELKKRHSVNGKKKGGE